MHFHSRLCNTSRKTGVGVEADAPRILAVLTLEPHSCICLSKLRCMCQSVCTQSFLVLKIGRRLTK
jgi:hypothetical protein